MFLFKLAGIFLCLTEIQSFDIDWKSLDPEGTFVKILRSPFVNILRNFYYKLKVTPSRHLCSILTNLGILPPGCDVRLGIKSEDTSKEKTKVRSLPTYEDTSPCPTPVLYVSTYSKNAKGVYLIDSLNENSSHKLIEFEREIASMTADHYGIFFYVATKSAKITVLERDSCSGNFAMVSTLQTNALTPRIILDSTERYIIEEDDRTSTVSAYRKNTYNTLTPTSSVLSGPYGYTSGKGIYVHNRIKSLFAVPVPKLATVYFFNFNSSSEIVSNLTVFAKLPDKVAPKSLAFSGDGKYMYVTSYDNLLRIFKIELNQAGDSIVSLTPVGQPVPTVGNRVVNIYSPNIVKVNPKTNYLYVSNEQPPSVASFVIADSELKLVNIFDQLPTKIKDFVINKDGKKLIAIDFKTAFLFIILAVMEN